MRVFVSGAGGFLGGQIVKSLVQAGHTVVAGVRRLPEQTSDSPSVSWWVGDLRHPVGLAESLAGVDCVIHAAAAKSGDLHEQLASTVVSTETLFDTARAALSVRRFVLISSFSVYDYDSIGPKSRLTEASPLIAAAMGRDAYAITKRLQESVVGVVPTAELEVVVLRPGVIVGPNNWWSARLGERFGGIWLCPGGHALVPIVTVENCAHAAVLACEAALTPSDEPTIVNLVDAKPPTQHEYLTWLKRKSPETVRIVRIPLSSWRLLAILLEMLGNRSATGLKVPSYLTPGAINARFKPLRYDTQAAQQHLKWQPDKRFSDPVTVGW